MVHKSWNVPKLCTQESSCRLWGSARLTYTLSAFLANILQMGMRNMLGLIILRMVRAYPREALQSSVNNITISSSCGGNGNAWMESTLDAAQFGDLQWSRTQALAFPGTFYYGFVFALPLAGHLTDRFGGKVLFINSLTLQGVAFILLPLLAHYSYAAAVTSLVFAGIFAGCGTPPLYQLFVVWAHPTERTAMLSFAYSGLIIGSICIYPLTTFLSEFGWSVPFYVIGSVSLAYGITCNWLIYNSVEQHPRISDAEREYLQQCAQQPQNLSLPWRSLLTSPPVLAFVLTHVFHNYTFLLFSLIIPRFMREAMQLNMKEIGFLSSAPFLGSLLSKIICILSCSIIERRVFANRSYLRRVLYAVCALANMILLSIIIIAKCEQKIFVLVMFVLLGVTTDMGFSGGYWPTLLYFAPSFAGMISGLANSVGHISGFLASHVIATLVKTGLKSEWNHVLLTLIFVNVLAIIVFGSFGSTSLQPWDPRSQKPESEVKPSNTASETAN
ncbi:hypothetical protein AWZ03_005108 [Drosophila navojoa]|uniref:Major facilitator superfamily (MFS) profile domain-containing protein n=1 Tax=Drosophila navojoa TaxID=7232 RepID=A0A484BHU9_DRONA|nr:sialin [Drosophila navojoa]TDG48363.1 hypothetical protein AWZ03_005108 [Drosophila navojoa]